MKFLQKTNKNSELMMTLTELMPIIVSALNRFQKVKMRITGSSMMPIILHNDEILMQKNKSLHTGDVVFFEYPKNYFAIHRIIKIQGEKIWVRGDSQYYSQGPIPFRAVYGIVFTSYHRGKKRHLQNGIWRFVGLIWFRSFPVSVLFLDLAFLLGKMFKKVNPI